MSCKMHKLMTTMLIYSCILVGGCSLVGLHLLTSWPLLISHHSLSHLFSQYILMQFVNYWNLLLKLLIYPSHYECQFGSVLKWDHRLVDSLPNSNYAVCSFNARVSKANRELPCLTFSSCR